jgi:hypothetical protein
MFFNFYTVLNEVVAHKTKGDDMGKKLEKLCEVCEKGIDKAKEVISYYGPAIAQGAIGGLALFGILDVTVGASVNKAIQEEAVERAVLNERVKAYDRGFNDGQDNVIANLKKLEAPVPGPYPPVK